MITYVRHRPDPLKSERSNTVPIRSIAVYKNEFGIVLDTSAYGAGQADSDHYPLTYAGIRRWIEDNFNVRVSKSSIERVKDKCGASRIGLEAGRESSAGVIKTEKEKLILEAFRALGII